MSKKLKRCLFYGLLPGLAMLSIVHAQDQNDTDPIQPCLKTSEQDFRQCLEAQGLFLESPNEIKPLAYHIYCSTFNSSGPQTKYQSEDFLATTQEILIFPPPFSSDHGEYCGTSIRDCQATGKWKESYYHLRCFGGSCFSHPIIVLQYCAKGPKRRPENTVTVRVGIIFDWTKLTVSAVRKGRGEKKLWATSFLNAVHHSGSVALSSLSPEKNHLIHSTDCQTIPISNEEHLDETLDDPNITVARWAEPEVDLCSH